MTFVPDMQKVNLGADAAEDDIRLGLRRYFIKSDSFESIRDGFKYIVVGNRGTGKTAIFKYLAESQKSSGSIVIELSPEDYSYEMLSSLLKKEAEGSWGKQSSYSISWQYLIFNLIFKEIASRTKGLAIGAKKLIYNYVRDNLKELDISPLGLLVSYLKRLEGVKFGEYQASIKKKDLYQLYELQDIKELFPSLCKILDSLNVFVYVDELDKGWDNSEEAKYFVAGLIQAAQKINIIHDNLKVFVSIRQELFDNIPQIYDDAQKIRGAIEVLKWTEDSMRDFISLRLADPFPELREKSAEDIWNIFFSETIEYRKANSFNYMVDRTQLRPREFLQLVRECLKRVGKKYKTVNYDDISHAVVGYSEFKAKDLASEYRFQFPGLLNLFNTFRGRKYNLDKDDLDLHLLEICDGDTPVAEAEWINNLEYFEIKRILWEIGFLKAWVIGGLKAGRKAGSSYVGHYELSSLNLDTISRFQIHPAFWPYLGLKEK
ncbi:MAG: ATP-binding protein [Desulfobacteraceae bacterium]|nr:MAG: ATP-binding protein [Desulfobacteraceae bacterium]